MRNTILLILSAVFNPADVGAFFIKQPPSPSLGLHSTVVSVTSSPKRLSDVDLMTIENVAEMCLNIDSMVDECDLEEHDALVNTLTEQRELLSTQRDILTDHLNYLDSTISKLLGHDVDGHSLDENTIKHDQ